MRYLKNGDGYALILTLVLLAVIVTTGTALFFLLNWEIKMNQKLEEKVIVTHLAESGVEYALYLLNNTDALEEADFDYWVVLFADEAKEYAYKIVKIVEIEEIEEIHLTVKLRNGERVKEIPVRATIDENGINLHY